MTKGKLSTQNGDAPINLVHMDSSHYSPSCELKTRARLRGTVETPECMLRISFAARLPCTAVVALSALSQIHIKQGFIILEGLVPYSAGNEVEF